MTTFHPFGRGVGSLEVICGSMFSGKSEELIRRVRRAQIARQRVQVFKPRIDDRYKPDEVTTHSAQSVACELVSTPDDILKRLDDRTEVIAIDEVQFLGPDVVALCERLANQGKRVIVAGLDQDYLGHPFEPMPQIMAVAEYVTKTLAVCARCGAPANRSQRLTPEEDQIVVGAAGAYEARCRRCFEPDAARQYPMPLEAQSNPDPDRA